MKITIFNGSPHAAAGATHKMAEEFATGAKEAGAEVENIFLLGQNIGFCRGCFVCWTVTPGICIIKDAMAGLIEKFVNSDVVVFATPLYVDNVTALMKSFMDRLIPILDPHFKLDEKGQCYHPMRQTPAPKIAVISNCGFPEQDHFQVLRLLFRRIARNMSTELVAEIYRGGGGVLAHPPLILKPLIWQYNGLLHKAGREVVELGKLSDKTIAELEKPLFSADLYLKGANKNWDKQLSKITNKQ